MPLHRQNDDMRLLLSFKLQFQSRMSETERNAGKVFTPCSWEKGSQTVNYCFFFRMLDYLSILDSLDQYVSLWASRKLQIDYCFLELLCYGDLVVEGIS
jgi:hypothetical protein